MAQILFGDYPDRRVVDCDDGLIITEPVAAGGATKADADPTMEATIRAVVGAVKITIVDLTGI